MTGVPVPKGAPRGGTVRRLLKPLENRIRYLGRKRYCPICRSHASRFLPHGLIERSEARCPYCGSLERHRLVWLFMERRTDLFAPPRKRMLHVAPELCMVSRLRRARHVDWLTADLKMTHAMVRMDVTQIQFPDDSFDVIYCSHVLEHVPDDTRAMREFARVLRPGGWAILQVPITAVATFEDPAVTDPAERERLFGQWDHVRRYGPDYADRLAAAGFQVERVTAQEFASAAEIASMRLDSEEQIHFCRTPELTP